MRQWITTITLISINSILGYHPSLPPICSGINFSSYASHPFLDDELNDVMYAYDAVLTVAKGLHDLMYSENIADPPPSRLHQYILNNSLFCWTYGEISFSTKLRQESYNVGGRGWIYCLRYLNFYQPSTSPVIYGALESEYRCISTPSTT